MARAARRSLAASLQKLFDPAVLERMKRNHRQPTAGHQQLFGRDQSAVELAEFVVDGNTQGLKGTCRRILAGLGFWHDRAHDFGEFNGAP